MQNLGFSVENQLNERSQQCTLAAIKAIHMLGWISNGTAKSSSSGFCASLKSCEIKYEVLNSAWDFSV